MDKARDEDEIVKNVFKTAGNRRAEISGWSKLKHGKSNVYAFEISPGHKKAGADLKLVDKICLVLIKAGLADIEVCNKYDENLDLTVITITGREKTGKNVKIKSPAAARQK